MLSCTIRSTSGRSSRVRLGMKWGISMRRYVACSGASIVTRVRNCLTSSSRGVMIGKPSLLRSDDMRGSLSSARASACLVTSHAVAPS